MLSPLFFLSLLLLSSASLVYEVSPTPCFSNSSCLTLSDYMTNTTKFFASGYTFLFLKGKHYLNTTLHLIRLSSINLIGTDSSEIIVGPGAGIVCDTSADISLQSLKVTHRGQSGIFYSALVIKKSQNISLLNVQFQGPDFSQGSHRQL